MRNQITDGPTTPAVVAVHRAPDRPVGRRRGRGRPGEPPLRRGSRALIAVFVLTIAAGSSLTVPAAPVLAHGRGTNGCTGVPDSGYGFDFHSICDRHDRCYRTRPNGTGYHGRRSCDRSFRAAMLDHCNRHPRYTVRRLACRSVSAVYYRGVRALGVAAWSRRSSPLIG